MRNLLLWMCLPNTYLRFRINLIRKWLLISFGGFFLKQKQKFLIIVTEYRFIQRSGREICWGKTDRKITITGVQENWNAL